MPAKQPLIVTVGEALMDFVAEETGVDLSSASRFFARPGGAMANTAVGLARLGARSRFVGKIGADPFGKHLQRVLRAEGVDLAGVVETTEYHTGLVFAVLDAVRVPHFWFFGTPSADMMLRPEEVGEELIRRADFLHVSTVSMVGAEARAASWKLIRLAGAAGVKVSFDPNLRLHLWRKHQELRKLCWDTAAGAAVVKLNGAELEFITGEKEMAAGAQRLRAAGVGVVVVTLGPEGAYYLGPGSEGTAPGFAVKVVDTIGAGDGFAAGLLTALAEAGVWPPSPAVLAAAVRFANAVGAMVTREIGALTALPLRSEVEAFLAVAEESGEGEERERRKG